MPGAFTDYLENQIVRHIFRNTAIFSPPAAIYVALFTVTPTDAGGGTEVSTSGTAYARVSVTTGASGGSGSGWTDPSGGNGVASNVNDITFPTATADWGTIVSFALFDALSGGNMLFWGALTTSKVVGGGGVFKFAASNLALTLD